MGSKASTETKRQEDKGSNSGTTGTMKAMRLNLVVIRSPNIDQAVKFYELLGLTFEKHSHGSGPLHYATTTDLGGLVFELYPETETAVGAIGTTSTRIGFSGFTAEELHRLVDQLEERNFKIVSPVKDSPWGLRAVVADGDGHRVELLVE